MTILVLAGGHLAECQGWLATPEARMACCANEQECPMHKAAQHPSGSKQRISQADADRCCATAGHGDSMPTSINASADHGLALFPVSLSAVVATLVPPSFPAIIEPAASPPTSRSRQVLLSVFLI